MRRAFAALAALLFLLAAPLDAAAQQGRVRGVGHLSFTVGVPQGEFEQNLDRPGYGINVFLGAAAPGSPFVIGLDFDYFNVGRTQSRTRFVLGGGLLGPEIDVVTTNDIVQPHLVLRAQPVIGATRPYVEALGGFKYLFTRTQIEDINRGQQDEEVFSSTDYDDFTWSYGAGAGIDFDLYTTYDELTGRENARIGLHLGVQWVFGPEAEYVAEGEIRDLDGDQQLDDDELDVRRSRTELIQPQIGISVYF
jgi:hypothetical protein